MKLKQLEVETPVVCTADGAPAPRANNTKSPCMLISQGTEQIRLITTRVFPPASTAVQQ